MVDAASFGAGVGAGQAIGRGEAESNRASDALSSSVNDALNDALRLRAKKENEVLKDEINNRWIPYAVTLKASLVARRVERSVLIDELRRLDPANVEAVVQKAEQACLAEFDTMEGAKLVPISQAIRQESEEGRLDR